MPTPTQQICDELQIAFDHLNVTLFENQLPPCMLTLQRQKKTRGYFSPKRFVSHNGVEIDEIALNPAYFALYPLEVVISTVAHEMAHQKLHHFGDPGRRGYHNKNWANAMIAIGLMPSHTGEPGGQTTGEKMTHYILPGGAFESSCRQLLTRQYRLSWMDRFPPPKALRQLLARAENQPPSGYDSDNEGDDVVRPDSEDGNELAKIIQSQDPPRFAVAPGTAVEEAVHRLESLRGMGIPVDEMISPSMPIKPNRFKYSCPECSVNLWGKPGLKLFCGQCSSNSNLVEFNSHPI